VPALGVKKGKAFEIDPIICQHLQHLRNGMVYAHSSAPGIHAAHCAHIKHDLFSSFFTTQWMSAPQISTAFLRQFPSISDVRNDERMARAYFTSEHVWSSTDPCRNILLQQFLAGNASDSKLDSRLKPAFGSIFCGASNILWGFGTLNMELVDSPHGFSSASAAGKVPTADTTSFSPTDCT